MLTLMVMNQIVLLCLFLPLVSPSATSTRPLFYGFDYGTSGVRCCMMDSLKAIVYEDTLAWSDLTADKDALVTDKWERAMDQLLTKTPTTLRGSVERICVSGTSSSVLMYDQEKCNVSRQPRMYDFNVMQQCVDPTCGSRALEAIRAVCPPGSAANAATSTLAKVLAWHLESPMQTSERLVHQADYLVHYLTGERTAPSFFYSDWHNALKLGFDVYKLEYPPWLLDLLKKEFGWSAEVVTKFLPRVSEPGRTVASVNGRLSKELGFNHPDCRVVAGTTDSIAAFLASGADAPGQAVTSLGSTLAIKLLSDTPVEDSSRGIYSHRLGDRWLVGGASNVGCAVLRQEQFSEQELIELSLQIDPSQDSKCGFYPLLKVGERFPISDPNKQPILSPKPLLEDGSGGVCRKQYLHGILQSIADVEKAGYAALRELGASPVKEVLTAGGGSKNDMWTKMRARLLQVPTSRATNIDAAYGCARLAAKYYFLDQAAKLELQGAGNKA